MDDYLHGKPVEETGEDDFSAVITQQIRGQLLAWRSENGTAQNGILTFYELGYGRARVRLEFEWGGENLPRLSSATRAEVTRRVESALQDFALRVTEAMDDALLEIPSDSEGDVTAQTPDTAETESLALEDPISGPGTLPFVDGDGLDETLAPIWKENEVIDEEEELTITHHRDKATEEEPGPEDVRLDEALEGDRAIPPESSEDVVSSPARRGRDRPAAEEVPPAERVPGEEEQ